MDSGKLPVIDKLDWARLVEEVEVDEASLGEHGLRENSNTLQIPITIESENLRISRLAEKYQSTVKAKSPWPALTKTTVTNDLPIHDVGTRIENENLSPLENHPSVTYEKGKLSEATLPSLVVITTEPSSTVGAQPLVNAFTFEFLY